MKLSLIEAASLALLASLAAACGTTAADELAPGAAPPPSEPPASAPAPTPRKLVDLAALPTSPTNLLLDPGFGLVGQQAGFGSFLTFADGSFQQIDPKTTYDSRSPAGFAGAVAIIKPQGATDKISSGATMLTSFQGGDGPFHAQVWVSKSDVKGNPVDIVVGKKGVTASVAERSPSDPKAYDLAVVPEATRTAGGRTWTLLRAEIPNALPYGAFFVVHVGEGGGQFHVASPEVVADALVAAVPARSLGVVRLATRPLTSVEQGAIARYGAIPPRLVPAAPKPKMGL